MTLILSRLLLRYWNNIWLVQEQHCDYRVHYRRMQDSNWRKLAETAESLARYFYCWCHNLLLTQYREAQVHKSFLQIFSIEIPRSSGG